MSLEFKFTNAIQVNLGSQNSILSNYQARLSFDAITKFWLNLQNECSYYYSESGHFELYLGVNVLGEIIEQEEEIVIPNRRLSSRNRGRSKGLCRGDTCPKTRVFSFPYRRRLIDEQLECSQTLLEALQENSPIFFGNLTEIQLSYGDETVFDEYVPCYTDACRTQFKAVAKVLDDFDVSDVNPEDYGRECSWNYVNCNVDTDNITSLIFFNEAISSTIPADIGLLEKLEWFDLPDGNLTGTIPMEIFDITSLKGFTVPNNNLNGTIPKEISGWKNLTNLNLSGNGFQGGIPTEVGLLENLETLDLSDNSLTGSVPSELGSLKNLQRVNLRGNENLTGIISSESCELFELEGNLVVCSADSTSLIPTSSTQSSSGSPSLSPTCSARFCRITEKFSIIFMVTISGVVAVCLLLLSLCVCRAIGKKANK